MLNEKVIKEISKKVKEKEYQLFNAIKEKDTSKIITIITSKFTYKNPKYGEISRDEFLENIKSLFVKIESVNSDNLSVKVLNDSLAIITGIQKSIIINNDEKQTVAFIKIKELWFLDFTNGIDLPNIK